MNPVVHPTAVVEPGAILEENVKVWHFSHIRKGAKLGPHVSIAKDVYVDSNVSIGEGTRVQNSVNIYNGVTINRWVFVGPAVVFTNDQHPRIGRKDWQVTSTYLEDCCSIGAGAVIRCGIRIGAFSMVGAGAIVTKDIPPFCLVTGVPADLSHRICACGDQTLPLITPISHVIQECCERNLEPHILTRAKDIIKELNVKTA